MSAYLSGLIVNAHSYVKPSWTFPKQTERVALYSQHPVPTPSVTYDTKSQEPACRVPVVPSALWAPRAGTMSHSIPSTSTVPGIHQKCWLVLAGLISRFSMGMLLFLLPFVWLSLASSLSGLGLNTTSSRKSLLATLAWLLLPHGPMVPHLLFPQHLPHSAVVACLIVRQANLILRFHEVVDQERPIHLVCWAPSTTPGQAGAW